MRVEIGAKSVRTSAFLVTSGIQSPITTSFASGANVSKTLASGMEL
jgi:hypothetical protein